MTKSINLILPDNFVTIFYIKFVFPYLWYNSDTPDPTSSVTASAVGSLDEVFGIVASLNSARVKSSFDTFTA